MDQPAGSQESPGAAASDGPEAGREGVPGLAGAAAGPGREVAVVLARTDGPARQTVLRRRGAVTELIVNGVFAMDTAHPDTEAALGRLALDRLIPDRPARTVVGGLRIALGGLGLGITLRTLLAEPRVARVELVELDAALIGWASGGLVPGCKDLLRDPRVRVRPGDVADVLPRLPSASLDAVLLDVDNGPGFLVHPRNARLYGERFLRAAASTLRPGGVLGIWSADPSRPLQDRLQRAVGACREVLLPVRRERRSFDHALYLAERRPSGDR